MAQEQSSGTHVKVGGRLLAAKTVQETALTGHQWKLSQGFSGMSLRLSSLQ